jgi:type IV pilus assembly protein PilN
MKIAVNLASRPYVELRPIYNRLRTWIVILILVGGALWYLYRSDREQAEAARAQVTSVESHVRELEQQQQSYQKLMQQPKQAGILEQAGFLNGLFQRKAFSWTATMTDLETVLPSGVQVLSIDPIVGPDGHVTIRLRVTGERARALELVRNLEQSEHFAQPRVASESMATQSGQSNVETVSTSNDVNLDILADYRPLPLETSAAKTGANPKSGNKKTGNQTDKSRTGANPKSGEKKKTASAKKPAVGDGVSHP